MRILWLIWRDWTSPDFGGEGVHLLETVRVLRSIGDEVTIFTSHHNHAPLVERTEIARIIRLARIPLLFALAPFYYVLFRNRYDVVIDEMNTIPFFAPFYARRSRFLFIHQLGAEVFREAPLRWKWQRKLLEKGEPLLVRIYRNSHILTVSESTKASLVSLGINGDRIQIIPNGISRDGNTRPGSRFVEPTLCYVGRIVPQKGLHFIVQCLPWLKHEFPNVRFVIAGRTVDPKYRNELGRLARNSKVSEAVEFRGYVSEAEKTNLLSRSHVFVIQSIREGWGLSAAEAMACGTPVVASDVPGLRESVQDGRTGVLVERGNVEQLARAIGTFLRMYERDPEEYQRFGDSCRARVVGLDWATSGNRFHRILEDHLRK